MLSRDSSPECPAKRSTLSRSQHCVRQSWDMWRQRWTTQFMARGRRAGVADLGLVAGVLHVAADGIAGAGLQE
eukprot:7299829-Alexandrium_andersonii.AAC.1